MHRMLVVSPVFFAAACAFGMNPATVTHVDGYAVYARELMIFNSPNPPPDDLTDRPRCLSAVPSKQFNGNLKMLDHKRVIVTGFLVPYESLPNEGGTRGAILPRKIADGFIVSNWCRSHEILLLQSVKVIADY